MKSHSSKPDQQHVLYGIHTVKAALLNPHRQCHTLFATQEALNQLGGAHKKKDCAIRMTPKKQIGELVGQQSVHQGCALSVSPLPATYLEDLFQDAAPQQRVMVLDQVTDPHNVGAILRSCAAFGAKALIIPQRQAPPENSAIMAKTACGAVEWVPLIIVANLKRSLEQLKSNGFWTVGFDDQGDSELDSLTIEGKYALVLGAEGDGLRRLTQEACDFLVRLPTAPNFPTLNVSNAAAVSLYKFSPFQ